MSDGHASATVAAALQMQADSQDMAGLLVEVMARQAQAEGRAPERADLTRGVGALLATAWQLAKLAHEDPAVARAHYVALLRAHADDVERSV